MESLPPGPDPHRKENVMLPSYSEAQKQAVIAAFENPKYKWRTVASVARETGLPFDIVESIIAGNRDLIVKSPQQSRTGEDLFSTRAHFSRFASATQKFWGAVKNRAV
jgi:hypothetical protein